MTMRLAAPGVLWTAATADGLMGDRLPIRRGGVIVGYGLVTDAVLSEDRSGVDVTVELDGDPVIAEVQDGALRGIHVDDGVQSDDDDG